MVNDAIKSFWPTAYRPGIDSPRLVSHCCLSIFFFLLLLLLSLKIYDYNDRRSRLAWTLVCCRLGCFQSAQTGESEKRNHSNNFVSPQFLLKGVESWAIAVATGATQLDLVNNIADRSPPAAYDHLQVMKRSMFRSLTDCLSCQVFGSATILQLNAPDQGACVVLSSFFQTSHYCVASSSYVSHSVALQRLMQRAVHMR